MRQMNSESLHDLAKLLFAYDNVIAADEHAFLKLRDEFPEAYAAIKHDDTLSDDILEKVKRHTIAVNVEYWANEWEEKQNANN